MSKPKFKKGDKVIIVEPSFYGNYWPSYGPVKEVIVEVIENRPNKDGDIKIKSKEGYWGYFPEEDLVPATRAHRILYG